METKEGYSGGLYSLGERALLPFTVVSLEDINLAYNNGSKGLRPLCKEHKDIAVSRGWLVISAPVLANGVENG